MKRPLVRFVPAGLAALSFALLAGCASTDRAAIEEARRSVPPMAATDTFFDGQLVAVLTVNSAFAESAPGGGKGSGGGGRHHGGGGGMRGHYGGGHTGRSMDGSSIDSEGGEGESSDQPHAVYVESPLPPAMLRLRLENKSTDTVTVEITNLNSELGNFATQPDKFTLKPGAVGEPSGMQSLLGLDTLALPVTLTLKSGKKSETKVLTLHVVNPPAAPAPASTAP